MIELSLPLLLSVFGALLADAFARPLPAASPPLRAWPGLWVSALVASLVFGAILAASGNPVLAAVFVVALQLVFVIGSNAKRRVLGEPLVFSDLALLGAMAKHPQFYFSVLALWQKVVGLVALLVLLGVMAWMFDPGLAMAAAGTGVALVSGALLALSVRLEPWRGLARVPDLDADVRSLGLVPTLLLYWLRWRRARAELGQSQADGCLAGRSLADGAGADGAGIIVVVQCESFADPADLFAQGGALLPELRAARDASLQWGNLHVSGFGAYTMRTEYGVLFGRAEDDLGFLLYDPYLTALEDPATALPARFGAKGWESLFVHPHDMRFYGRDQILPKAGFTQLIGEDAFASPDPRSGRYVSDAQVAAKIIDLARAASSPTFIYAVTMENHGPWAPHGDASTSSMVENYNRLVLAGDTMLGRLRRELGTIGKPATLVFFGDHRPTIPGASDPGGDRFTPYVVVRCDEGEGAAEAGGASVRVDLTPAQLHRAILTFGECRKQLESG